MRRHIWDYAVCLCLIKKTQGLYELKTTASDTICSVATGDPWEANQHHGNLEPKKDTNGTPVDQAKLTLINNFKSGPS